MTLLRLNPRLFLEVEAQRRKKSERSHGGKTVAAAAAATADEEDSTAATSAATANGGSTPSKASVASPDLSAKIDLSAGVTSDLTGASLTQASTRGANHFSSMLADRSVADLEVEVGAAVFLLPLFLTLLLLLLPLPPDNCR